MLRLYDSPQLSDMILEYNILCDISDSWVHYQQYQHNFIVLCIHYAKMALHKQGIFYHV